MDKLLKKRKALVLKIDALKTVVDQHAVVPLSKMEIQEHLERVIEMKKKNNDLHDDIVSLCKDDADILQNQAVYNIEETKLHEMKIQLMTIMLTFAAPTAPHVSAEVKLPKLELPVFTGEIQDWLSFQDLFSASVHLNTKLTGAQKLQYLKAALKGEPSSLIQNYQVTDLNYSLAWDTLKLRYENRREIIKSHFDRLLSMQILNQENPAALRKLGDTTSECVRALEIMKISPEQARDLLIIHLISKKLDSETRLQWERTLKPDAIPTVLQFTDFILQHARVTAAAGVVKKPPGNQTTVKANGPTHERKATTVHYGASSNSKMCSLCQKSEHYLSQCEDYQKMSKPEKVAYLKKSGRCFNCLDLNHRSSDCKSKWSCKTCRERHHTSIHFEKEKRNVETESTESTAPETKPATVQLASNFGSSKSFQTLLATALIKVKTNTDQEVIIRALLDSGSQVSVITKKCAARLGLKQHPIDVPLSGLGGTEIPTMRVGIDLQFQSQYKNNQKFYECSSIDVLLGLDIFDEILKTKKRPGPQGTPSARDSHLGWLMMGKSCSPSQPSNVRVHHVVEDLDSTLKMFWEIEDLPAKKILTKEEKLCEDQFANTHKRDPSGKFIVKLPFKDNCQEFGESRNAAVKRLQSMERRHSKQPQLMKEYNDVLQEYLTLEHMEKVPLSQLSPHTKVYYMPHHSVINEASSTTKLRVVFDASCKSTNGVSLNDNLMVGPKLQDDLISILMRFRIHKIALTADITKMYRQVKIVKEDVDCQRIVWRKTKDDPIEDYRLLTATFGTASAPYQAVKCVQQLAIENMNNCPSAAKTTLHDFYVDDLMSGASSVQEAMALQKELISLLKLGGFQLRKWSSNSTALLQAVPEEMRETRLPLKIETDSSVKTLGLQWHPAGDYFSFVVCTQEYPATTKRKILSEMAKIFDPLGWLSPVTIKAKIFLQQLWKTKLDWDDALPEELQDFWKEYARGLPLLARIQIPRWCTLEKPLKYQLWGFSDASETAFAAVVYLRSIACDGKIEIKLIAAKTKVAPVKQITLARLELCGAVLLSRLLQVVRDSLKLDIDKTFAYTDSTIVLDWLASPPQRWKTFVANRVSEIQEAFPREIWFHVKGEENPADCASRGIFPLELEEFRIWWNGPNFLQTLNEGESSQDIEDEPCLQEERNVAQTSSTVVQGADFLPFQRCGTLEKLKRVTAYVLRFCNNARQSRIKLTGVLTLPEMKNAMSIIVKAMQTENFKNEIMTLKQRKPLKRKSVISNLNPFIDKEGFLRVGGRLHHADISFDKKHPILLPKSHIVTELIIKSFHKNLLHGGSQLLLANLQNHFWIIGARDFVRRIIRKCVVCTRLRAETCEQMMGNLPKARITQSRAFQHCGVDFAGPFTLKNARGRNPIKYKAYVAVFICLVTRAIHLEVVSDMTTDSFLETFKRFVATRGKPTDVYSDCGTNFVGANRELKDYLKSFNDEQSQGDINNYIVPLGITWHFSPPSGPTFGGLWEAGVKSMKFHLKRVVGTQLLNFEEMITVLKQIEACLNSRPLSAVSSDPNDLKVLTPGHFLIGDALTAIPEPDLTDVKMNRLSRWQMTQQMFQHFWKRWSGEHLTRLQQRPKWWSEKQNVAVGDLVLIKDNRFPPLMWKMGRILEVSPGDDKRVRVVKLKTAEGELIRPVTKLCLLPIEQ